MHVIRVGRPELCHDELARLATLHERVRVSLGVTFIRLFATSKQKNLVYYYMQYAFSVTDIVVGKGVGSPSLNPRVGCLSFNSCSENPLTHLFSL